jgi:hypothetical protein
MLTIDPFIIVPLKSIDSKSTGSMVCRDGSVIVGSPPPRALPPRLLLPMTLPPESYRDDDVNDDTKVEDDEYVL